MSLLPRFYKSHYIKSANPAATTVELYLDYQCMYSAKLFKNWYRDIIKTDKGGDYNFIFRNYIQPWHPSSSMVHEASFAYAALNPSKFWEFSLELFEKIEEFYDTASAGISRNALYERIYDVVIKPNKELLVDRDEFLSYLTIKLTTSNHQNSGNKVQNDVKYFTKIGRQNGVHVTPTVLIDGIKEQKIESSTSIEQVLQLLG